VALGGLCPRCGAKTLFKGMVAFAPSCRACGLDLTTFNVGDGAAAFLTLIVGGLVGAMAVIAQLTLHLPFWLHAIIWVPIAAVLVIGLMRIAKAMLLALEYRHKASEGRIVTPDEEP